MTSHLSCVYIFLIKLIRIELKLLQFKRKKY